MEGSAVIYPYENQAIGDESKMLVVPYGWYMGDDAHPQDLLIHISESPDGQAPTVFLTTPGSDHFWQAEVRLYEKDQQYYFTVPSKWGGERWLFTGVYHDLEEE